ncbi:MAG TPA: signal peptidase I [Terriglobia bacterium]|nr:signal peptidase I [Terriglobia bacterium]
MTEATTFKKSTAREYFESLAITVILALFGTTFIVQAFKIPTPSMEDNLLVGDHLLVNKFAFGAEGSVFDAVLPFREIQRGDIIVFKYPKDLTKHFVKRVIGLPGDRVKIVDKKVYVNDELIPDERYHVVHRGAVYAEPQRDNLPLQNRNDVFYGEGDPRWFEKYVDGDSIRVPPRSYFAMGDNRDNSLDSRYWGFVPRENIVGKPLMIYWSYASESDEFPQPSAGGKLGELFELLRNFPTKTRWDRTFKLIR